MKRFFTQIFFVALVAITLLSGCKSQVNDEKLGKLSTRFIDNCDIIELNMQRLHNYKQGELSDGQFVEKKIVIKKALIENIKIASQLPSREFKSFTQLLKKLARYMDKDKEAMQNRNSFSRLMAQYHRNLGELMLQYMRIIQNLNRKNAQRRLHS
ncbi:MAG: hypothetical protein HQK83_16955 [Fibrobacteria bacterium]|nr:hypothetical protein [Fibrobacteria bacterium]